MTPDWTILAEEGVREVADKAARRLAENFSNTIEAEDALQEALIVLASRSDEARRVLAKGDGLGLLHNWLYQYLVKQVRTEDKHRARHLTYDAIEDRADPRFS